ncbi:hypothetical protein Nepgr_014510 [Nepenthes gracilis]|uniref:Uncharacterized protein n=1 Tax=Nepenthes gracilis TaxID=150966 RepID=A0AAD3SKY7_NEPGR|nr:hypothetical protein Nepgr_014510 [Nepenthes gracilis]
MKEWELWGHLTLLFEAARWRRLGVTGSNAKGFVAVFNRLLPYSKLNPTSSSIAIDNRVGRIKLCRSFCKPSELEKIVSTITSSCIKVLIECDQVKKQSTATTEHDGSFKAELPSRLPALHPATDCQARLLGGSDQLYASSKNMASQIIKAGKQTTTYTTATPLTVGESCSSVGKHAKCGARLPDFDSSKTIDLPIPAEFGLPPTSYYIPLFPIIGIP